MRLLIALFLSAISFFAHSANIAVDWYWEGNPSAVFPTCGGIAGWLDATYPVGGNTRVCPTNYTVLNPGVGYAARVCLSTNMNICNDVRYTVIAEPPPPVTCPAAGTSGGDYRYTTASTVGTPTTYAEYDGECVLREVDRFCTSDGTGIYHCVAKTEYTGNPCPAGGCDGAGTDVPPPAPAPDPSIPPNTGPCAPGYYYGTVNGQTTCVPGVSTTTTSAPKTVETTKPDGSGTSVTTTGTTTTGNTPNGTPTVTTTWGTETMRWDVTQPSQNVGSPPAGATAPTNAGETKTSTVTNPDGSVTKHEVTKKADGTYDVKSTNGTVEKTQNTTTCTGSTCTTDTTKTENGQTTETITGTGSKDGICKETPSNPVCGSGTEGMFGGTCDAGFTCEGDAVQCAIARELHTRQCQLYSDKEGDATRYADAVSGADGKSAQALKDAAAAGASNIGVFNTSGYGWGRSCPADPHIPLTWVSGGELVIPFSRICGPLGLLAAGAVAMNLLGCMVFVVRT